MNSTGGQWKFPVYSADGDTKFELQAPITCDTSLIVANELESSPGISEQLDTSVKQSGFFTSTFPPSTVMNIN